MNHSESPVFGDEFGSLELDLLDVGLDLNWVVPGDALAVLAALPLGVLNYLFEGLRFVKHHGLLALNHLCSHGIVEISYLLQRYSFLVELLGVFSHT